MAFYTDLPVYSNTYQLILKVFEYSQNFPSDYKYNLSKDMKLNAMQLIRSFYRANKYSSRKAHLKVFLDEFELLKLQIRLCVDLRILPLKKQAILNELMVRIGKQVTSWRNSSQ